MAQKTTVTLVDDVDGGDADETVSFALDDVAYAIDLSTANAAALRDAMAPWVGYARKTTRPGRADVGGAPRRRKSEGRSDLAEVRAWGKDNGFSVSERGRISAELQTAYDAAHA
jgi:hypothetical protein